MSKFNRNYALDFGLYVDSAIYKDTVLDEEQYWNLIAARTEDLSDPKLVEAYEKVVEAFQSDATEDVFNDTFGGYFIKVGWGLKREKYLEQEQVLILQD